MAEANIVSEAGDDAAEGRAHPDPASWMFG